MSLISAELTSELTKEVAREPASRIIHDTMKSISEIQKPAMAPSIEIKKFLSIRAWEWTI